MRLLLDNSTITGAFRALGVIPSAAVELFDLDIASLGTLVDAVLLGEHITVLDDYKPEYSAERKKLLRHDHIRFFSVPPKLDRKISRDARAHVVNWRLSRSLSTTLVGIFDELALLFRHAWRNSEAFVVLKSLGIDNKYGNEIERQLLDHVRGEMIDPCLLAKTYNRETQRVVKAISWAAVRTVYYRALAKLFDAEYMPHPVRNTFNLKCIAFDNHPQSRTTKLHSSEIGFRPFPDPASHIGEFFKTFWTTCAEKDKSVLGLATFDIAMPPFLAWFLKKCGEIGGPSEAMSKLFELRDSPGVTALRTRLAEAQASTDASDLRRVIVDFDKLGRELQVYLGYDRVRVPVTAKLVEYAFSVPRFLTKPLYPHKPHLALIRDVILDLSSISSYGRLLDAFKLAVRAWARPNPIRSGS